MPGFIIGGQPGGEGAREPANTVETLRAHRWKIVNLNDEISGDVFGPDIIAESLQLPNVDIEVQEVKGALITYKFAKSVRWDDVTVTFYDTAKLLPRLIEEWRDKVYTNEKGIRPHKGYKVDAAFELLDGAGNSQLKVTLKNSWIRRIMHGPLSYASSDIKIVTLIISYDFAEFEGVGEQSDTTDQESMTPAGAGSGSSKSSNKAAAERTEARNIRAAESRQKAIDQGLASVDPKSGVRLVGPPPT